MRAFLALLFTLFYSGVFCQQISDQKIQINITDAAGNSLPNTTVELLQSSDSSLVKSGLADDKGVIQFDKIPPGKYLARATSASFTSTFSPEIQLGQNDISLDLKLEKTATNLQAVVVEGKKPFLQKLSDRIVVNVENSIVNAGNSAYEVLERSPGVTFDQNDVISMRGKQGVIIMIDGKPTALSGADLANYLKSLPSSAVERIDLITNPSAKYDAAGNAGIIDIRMKKDKRLGTNGTLTLGAGEGQFPRSNAALNLNHRTKGVNLFGNYSYATRVFTNHLFLDRNFYDDGQYSGGDLKDNYSKTPFASHTARGGADFYLGKKTIVGFVVNANFSHFTREAVNSSQVINSQKNFTSTFTSSATNNDHNRNVVSNVNFKHSFDSTGKEISADIDYGYYGSTSLTRNITRYYKLDGSNLQPDYILDGDQSGKLHFTTAKADFVNPFHSGWKLETGFKLSFVSSDNDAKFFDVSSGTPENDENKTNHFIYKENNNAGYVTFSREFKKFNIQGGLRAEQTNIQTDQKVGNVLFDSSYLQVFPSGFFNYKLKEDQTLGLSVSRRIDRPGYGNLNPFLFLIDVSTYATGNPRLLPQLTWSYELSYTLKSLNFSISYSHTKDDQNITLARFKEVFPNIPSDDNVTVQIPINLSSSEYYGLTVSAPVKVSKWWNMVNNGNLYYQKYKGHFSGTVLNNGKPAANIRSNNTFTLSKKWQAELNGSLNTGGQYGFMVLDPQWSVDAGVQVSVLKKKGQLRLNVSDIFYTNLPKAVVTYDNYVEKWHALRETRFVFLNFTYRFGNSNVQGARRRATGSEEERQRAG